MAKNNNQIEGPIYFRKFLRITIFNKLIGTGFAALIIYILPLLIKIDSHFKQGGIFILFGFLWVCIFSYLEAKTKNFEDFKRLGEIEMIGGAVFLGLFLIFSQLADIWFFIFSFIIMGAAYNFSSTSPYIIATIGSLSLLYSFLIFSKDFSFFGIVSVSLKIFALFFWARYGGLLVEALKMERKNTKKIQSLYLRLKKNYQKLRVVDKAKDNFIEVTSHQIRTPLALIEGTLSMAIKELNHHGTFPTSLMEKAYDGTVRMQTLVKNLLSVSRIEVKKLQINLEKVYLSKLAQSVYEEFNVRAKEKKINLILEAAKNIPIIKTDSEKIRELMEIFVDNALKYTLKGYVKIKVVKEGKAVVFLVEDSGIGVPREFQGEIFKKFGRAENVGMLHPEGTGLGLYIAKVTVSKLKGKLVFKSQEGVGSTFGFKLPIR